MFWHYPHFSNQMGRPAGAVRLSDYKLIELFETGQVELYNLTKDADETQNLAQTNPTKTAELHRLL